MRTSPASLTLSMGWHWGVPAKVLYNIQGSTGIDDCCRHAAHSRYTFYPSPCRSAQCLSSQLANPALQSCPHESSHIRSGSTKGGAMIGVYTCRHWKLEHTRMHKKLWREEGRYQD